MPPVTLERPVFTFADEAVSSALNARLDEDAAKVKERFVSAYRKSGAADSQGWFLIGRCTPTLVRPTLVSIHCYEQMSIAGNEAHHSGSKTFTIDGSKLREMSPTELFRAPVHREGGFFSLVLRQVMVMRDSCPSASRIDEQAIERSIEGFTVSEEGMIVLVGASEIGMCGAPNYEVDLAWHKMRELLDPNGPITRIEASSPSSR